MGKKSQSVGALFERIFERSCHSHGVAVTRIPNGCRQVGKNIVRVKTPWDWILTYQNKSAFIDTKTIDNDVYHCSMITPHQVKELFKHESAGAIAGYVIWLRLTNRVFFIPSLALKKAMTVIGSFSDSHPEAIYLGNNQFDIRLLFNQPLQS